MKIFGAKETTSLLPYPALIKEIREIAIRRVQGKEDLHAPARTVMPLPGGSSLLVMPAADSKLAITELVTVHPENLRCNLTTLQSEAVVIDAQTGRRLGILESKILTARRTAVLSLLAAKMLASLRMVRCSLWGQGAREEPISRLFVKISAPIKSSSPRVPARTPGSWQSVRRFWVWTHGS